MSLIPHIKGRSLFQPSKNNIDFVTLSNYLLTSSIATVLLSLVFLAVQGLNYGVDFRGGSIIEIRSKNGPPNIESLRETVGSLGLGDIQIQTFGTDSDLLIRVEQQKGGEKAQQYALERILSTIGENYEKRRAETVGPTVSEELRTTGLIAVLCSVLAIICYVWFRFEWQFAVGAVVALVHDIIITIGVFSIFQLEFDLSTVAALMTILGYSVNDTVVVSDRIRENLKKYKKISLSSLVNRSINETLARTLMTSLTTLIVLLAIYIFGGQVIRNFTFAMMFGVIIGTYSSIFILGPLLMKLDVKRDWPNASNS
ncbi:MAG: Protein translocase subunit SecF [Hyphomicrobiaceae bacterium hypho_1]